MKPMDVKRFFAIFIMLLCVMSSATNAANSKKKPTHHKHIYKDSVATDRENSWFAGVGVGRSWTNLSNNYTMVSNGSFATPPSDQDYFSIKHPSPQTQIQFNLGYQWHKKRNFIPYYSTFVQYRHYATTYFKGNVTQYSLPEFLNYDYKMRYTADLFTINGKFDLFEYKKLLPYVSGGVGVIYNHLNNYSETALDNVTARDNPAYSGNTNADLAFTLGVGLDYKFTQNWWATLGCEHLFQGKIKTGKGAGSWSGDVLSFGKNTKMNTVFLSISANLPDGIRS